MLILRDAVQTELDFLVGMDRKDEGCGSADRGSWEPEELAEHRGKVAAFLSETDKAAWVYEDTKAQCLIGMILWRYRSRLREKLDTESVFGQLDERLFPPDGAFCEIYQLWVAPEYRRRGLASHLKQQAETESLRRGVLMIYTHTAECNRHVIEMNLKLGYREVRRGPIWDEVVRVSLLKTPG